MNLVCLVCCSCIKVSAGPLRLPTPAPPHLPLCSHLQGVRGACSHSHNAGCGSVSHWAGIRFFQESGGKRRGGAGAAAAAPTHALPTAPRPAQQGIGAPRLPANPWPVRLRCCATARGWRGPRGLAGCPPATGKVPQPQLRAPVAAPHPCNSIPRHCHRVLRACCNGNDGLAALSQRALNPAGRGDHMALWRSAQQLSAATACLCMEKGLKVLPQAQRAAPAIPPGVQVTPRGKRQGVALPCSHRGHGDAQGKEKGYVRGRRGACACTHGSCRGGQGAAAPRPPAACTLPVPSKPQQPPCIRPKGKYPPLVRNKQGVPRGAGHGHHCRSSSSRVFAG